MHMHADAEEDRTPEIVPPISPRAPWRVAEVNAQPGFRLRVRFNDGTEGEVNMAALNPYEVGVCQAQKIYGEKF